jgi:hypothetical protein
LKSKKTQKLKGAKSFQQNKNGFHLSFISLLSLIILEKTYLSIKYEKKTKQNYLPITLFFPVQTHKIIFLCILFLLQKNQTHAQHTPQTNKEKSGR